MLLPPSGVEKLSFQRLHGKMNQREKFLKEIGKFNEKTLARRKGLFINIRTWIESKISQNPSNQQEQVWILSCDGWSLLCWIRRI